MRRGFDTIAPVLSTVAVEADEIRNRLGPPTGSCHDIAVVIPAYRPEEPLGKVVRGLADAGFRVIVVVDDGSGPGYESVFQSVAQIAGVRVVSHAINLGKGAALKTGLNLALCEFPGLLGVVTVDADGQHKPADVLRVASRLERSPAALVLGARAFAGTVPLRSRLGNTVTRGVVRLLVGEKLRDTQTGLRGIPVGFATSLLRLPSAGYDFELDMLVAARRQGIAIVEEPIETIYEQGNKSSHFNPLVDSMKIYFVLVRFCSVSLLTALLDNIAFYIAYRQGAGVLGGQVAGRCLAVLFNYLMVRWAVFQTRNRHSTTVPRYLTLVVASGAVSYACISLLLNATHIPVLWAKIGVESLLFFVNFAVQRDWVFRRGSSDTEEPAARPSRLFGLLLWAALLFPLVLEIVYFRSAHLLALPTWDAIGQRHFEHYAWWFAAGAAFIGVFLRRYFVSIVAGVILVCSLLAVGPLAVFAVLLFVFSATLLGRLVFGGAVEARLAFPGGLAVWIVAMSLTAHLPIHYPGTYLAALLLPLGIGYRQAWALLRLWFDALRPVQHRTLVVYAPLAVIGFLVGAYWLIVLKPEVSTDGLGMHLAVAADMAMHHVFTFDFRKFVWALMPMGADWCYSVAYMLGGEYAARLLNFALLLATCVLLFRAAGRFVSTTVAALLTALFLSTPMVLMVTGSMFVENFVASMELAAVTALWRFRETRSARYLLLTATLFGAAVSLKIGALPVLLLALPFAGVAIAQAWPQLRRRPTWLLPLAVMLVVGIGGLPYANAWLCSGNPVFPFANDRFHSPFVGTNAHASLFIRDARYVEPLTWSTPVGLTFYTNRYFEGQDGTFGFQYLLLLPLTVLCLISMRSFEGGSVAVVGLGTAVLIAATTPNARYFYPILPFLTAGAAAALGQLHARQKILFAVALGLVVPAGLANIYFMPSADYNHRDFYSAPLFSEKGRLAYLHQQGAVRVIVDYLNRTDPKQPVAYTDGSQIAGLIPPAYTMAWHNYPFWTKIWSFNQTDLSLHLLNQLGVHSLVVDSAAVGRPFTLTALIVNCGQPAFSVGTFSVVNLRSDCETVLHPPPGVLMRGKYDDSDPHIVFHGDWLHSGSFPATWGKTVSYVAQEGHDFSFAMSGTGFRYVHTKAFNRGRAQILVDGQPSLLVDLYSPVIEWQASATVSGLSPGFHNVVVRATRQKSPQASDYFIDLDAIEIF